MRLAILGDGSLNHIKRWGGFFQRQGHEVLLLSFEETVNSPVPVIDLRKHLPTDLLGYLSSLGAVKKRLRAFRPDIVNSLYITGYGLIGALCGYRPLVLSALGSDLLVDYRKHFIHKLQINYSIGKADLITADSEDLSRIAAEAGAMKKNILKIYFGIDKNLFYPSDENTEPSAGNGKTLIISTRNLYSIYNIDLLIEASPKILKEINAYFIICGDGPERENLEKKVDSLGVGGKFTFKGRLSPEKLSEELRKSDIYISTSLSDSTSVSLLEAMASGLTPIVTDLEGNREWIEDGENGMIVPAGSPRILAESVVKTVKDRNFTRKARKINISRIKERGLWEVNMKRVEEEMLRLIEETKRRRPFKF
ncbi:MAG TPA: glycosyltransferase [Candidatus Krumholzibacteriaceae bacterium]|nr:glycosyltransferase [Candidatus Krumholzibacteriaceae bacterium]